MDLSNINDDSIDVEEIMRKIKDNMERSKETREDRDVENMVAGSSDGKKEIPAPGDETQRALDYINSNWDIQNNRYFISSHRRVIGKALTKGRELIHGEVQRYVDPMVDRQKEFNRSIVTILNGATSEIKNSIDQVQNQVQKSAFAQIDEKTSKIQAKIPSEIQEQVRAVIMASNDDIEKKAWLAGILEKRINKAKDFSLEPSKDQDSGINYFVFEEMFRGSRADIKGRQSAFIKYFEGCKNVLDIGCGRGEFLELLKDVGVVAKGIDLDEDMVDYCRSRGLDVEKVDAIFYLEKIEDKSLNGIFLDQVIEHLDPSYLTKLLSLCYSKLMLGYYIVIETVNPLSLFSFINFYLDMSHRQPIHPETIRFLMRSFGFREIELKFSSPVPDEARLKKISIGADASVGEKDIATSYNYNIDMLNNVLYGPQDYAIIGKK